MNVKEGMIKGLGLVLITSGLIACGNLPKVSEVFSDQKEAYKKAHELPPLEVPPELLTVKIKDEYDGAAKGTVFIADKNAVVTTTPLADATPAIERIENGVDSHLLVHDSLSNAWRKTMKALEELDYDIEDKNRESSLIYLNVTAGKKEGSMLATLSFWKESETVVYIVGIERIESGIAVRVLDEERSRIDNELSRGILADLLGKLQP